MIQRTELSIMQLLEEKPVNSQLSQYSSHTEQENLYFVARTKENDDIRITSRDPVWDLLSTSQLHHDLTIYRSPYQKLKI